MAEYEKKQTQSRIVLSTAKSKITSQKEQIEKQNGEINELKQKVNEIERQTKEEGEMRLNTLKSQYDHKINRLEKELSTLRNPASVSATDNQQQLDQVLKENADLQSKIQQLQKQVENLSKQQQQQQMVTPQQVTRTPVTVASIPTAESSVKTANIKPMATSTAPVRPSAPIQHQHPSAAARVTASIRPMAMAPTTSVAGITPTATVMPTTLSQQELTDETSSSSGPSATIPAVSVTPRVTQQVQIVTPQIETINNDTAMETTAHESSAVSPIATVLTHDTSSSGSPIPMQQSVTPIAQHPVTPQPTSVAITPQTNVTPVSVPPQSSVTPVTPQPSITPVTAQPTTPVTPQPSSSGTQVVTPQPSTSGTQLGKRQREDTDSQEESDAYTKRTRTQSQEQGIPAITVTDEHAQTITHLSPQSSALLQEQSQTDRRRQAVAPRNQQQPTPGATPIGIDDDDDEDDGEIIVLGSDDEEQVYEMEEYRENDDKNMKAYTEMDDEEEYEEDDDDEDDDEDDYDDDESDEIGESNQEDSNDVVIIDDNEQQGQQRRESVEVEQATSSTQQTIQPIQPVVDATSRPTSTDLQTRSQPLTPFMLGNQPGLFEEEDGLVPSTPTLFIPVRRSDGFAEAISSPAAPQRFVFGGDNSSNQPELAQLESQRALGMDDTRMDLSQLDEGRGPVTPAQVVPRSAMSTDNTSLSSTISAAPVIPPVSASASSDTTTTTLVTTDAGQSAIEFEDDDEALLEGLQGDEEIGDEITHDTETGEGITESISDQPEEVPSTSTGITQQDDDKATGDNAGASRPKIQRIVWGEQEATPSTQTPPTANQGRGGRATRRGRGSAWRGPSRGGPRGGFRQF